MNYSRSMLLSKEVQNWTHLFRMCSHGANTYKYHMPDSFKVISFGDTVNSMFQNKRRDFDGNS